MNERVSERQTTSPFPMPSGVWKEEGGREGMREQVSEGVRE